MQQFLWSLVTTLRYRQERLPPLLNSQKFGHVFFGGTGCEIQYFPSQWRLVYIFAPLVYCSCKLTQTLGGFSGGGRRVSLPCFLNALHAKYERSLLAVTTSYQIFWCLIHPNNFALPATMKHFLHRFDQRVAMGKPWVTVGLAAPWVAPWFSLLQQSSIWMQKLWPSLSSQCFSYFRLHILQEGRLEKHSFISKVSFLTWIPKRCSFFVTSVMARRAIQ